MLSRTLIVEESPLIFGFAGLDSYSAQYVDIRIVKLYTTLGVLCQSLMLNVCKVAFKL